MRLTEEEWALLDAAANDAGMSVSGYARNAILHQKESGKHRFPRFKDDDAGFRTERVRINLTLTEREWIEQRARWLGCGVPGTIRRMIFEGRDVEPIVIDTTLLNKTFCELYKQGVNLNQYIHYLNTYKSEADASEASAVLHKVYEQIDRLESVEDDLKSQIRASKRRSR